MSASPELCIRFGELLFGVRFELRLSEDVTLKAPDTYRVVGRSSPRVDIPAKATGALTYVHDMRVPKMLHGRVVRPPMSVATAVTLLAIAC